MRSVSKYVAVDADVFLNDIVPGAVRVKIVVSGNVYVFRVVAVS